jgi:regulator of cell morphogenesis and NO signaling
MATSCGCQASQSVLDVRELPPRIRHPKIFQAFDALPPGGRFVLVNDHDPKPLFYQFQFERPGAFDWRYVEQGPEIWRVEIARRAAAAPGPFGPTVIVADVTARSPRAAEVLRRFGIDHCCSAGLTLAEAAAAVGLDLEVLLRALNEAA